MEEKMNSETGRKEGKAPIKRKAGAEVAKALAAVGILTMIAGAVGGCQKYEKLDISAAQSQEGESSREAGGAAPGSEAQKESPSVQSSAFKPDVTTETAPELEARDEVVYINGTNVNVRKAPSPNGEVVARLNTGEPLKRTGYSQSWSQVE